MKKITLLTLLVCVILTSCKKKEQRVFIEKVTLEKGQTFDNFLKKYSTIKSFKNGESEFVLANKKDDKKRLLFYTKGLKNDTKEILRFRGNLLDVFVADIDKNNLKELYITSSPLKGKGYETVKDVDVFGYTLKDGKVARISTSEETKTSAQDYTDKITLKNNTLTRTYIVNEQEKSFNYKLTPNGNNFNLTKQ